MVKITQYSSMLERLNAGLPINVNDGSFGKPGGGNLVIVKDDYGDMQPLVTGAGKYSFFDGSRATQPNLTNCTAATVPGGERYDLYGLEGYIAPPATFGALTDTQSGLLRDFLRSASLEVKLSSITIINEPLFTYFGNQAYSVTYATPTLAVASTSNSQSWEKRWPDDLYFTLQSTVLMTFTVTLNAATTNVGLNGVFLGFSFPRVKASTV